MDIQHLATQERLIGVQCRAVEEEEEALRGDYTGGAQVVSKALSPRFVMVSHPDHPGLAQEMKAKRVRLIVLEQQLPAIPLLKTYMKPVNPYVDITLHDNLEMTSGESRAFLTRIGIAGEIISTPGHSDDSVSLVLDEGIAFTGDLPPSGFVDERASDTVRQSWETLRGLSVRMIYPGHGPIRPRPPVAVM